MRSSVAAAVLVAVAGCVTDPTTSCGSLTCPADEVCTSGGICATQAEISACVGENDRDPCTTSMISNGACGSGACHPIACGDHIVDPGEACDPPDPGNGCSADCRSNETCGNGVVDADRGEQCDDGNLLSSDGCSSTCQLETPAWNDVSALPIGDRTGMMMAFDVARAEVVAFGGASDNGPVGDTWLWDGLRWAPAVPVVSPSARSRGAVAYDSLRARTVLFGGAGEPGSLGDMWTWDGFDWTELFPATSPSPRTRSAMAYDSQRDRIVLFGGEDEAGDLADTWEFDGTTWSLVTPTASPPELEAEGMAYDASRGVIVMSGEGRTWEYSGTTWTEVVTPGPANLGIAMAYDSTSEHVIAFGGTQANQAGFVSGLMSWDGNTWTALANSSTPSPRASAAMAYDPVHDQLVLYGGSVYGQMPFSDTWLWQAGWIAPAMAQLNPPPLWAESTIYDPLAGHVMVFGGVTTTNAYSEDTWIRDRAGWTQLAPAKSPPDGFGCTSLVYDVARQQPLLLGTDVANNFGLWQWTGTTWQSVNQGSTVPPGVCGQMMAYDAARGRTVLFGGFDLNNNPTGETWVWDGTAWTDLTLATEPPPRGYGWMEYDPVRQRIVLFGGLANSAQADLGDTWEWDGTTWTDKTPELSPAARGFDSLGYDPQRRRMVLYGGAGIGVHGDQWEWDGMAWTQVSFLETTPARCEAPLVYDAIQKQLVYFGGIDFTNDALATTDAQQYTSHRSIERCLRSTDDDDGDGLAGCADPDCWGRCAPLCPPGAACPATAPHCGDGVCGTVEDHSICPADCP